MHFTKKSAMITYLSITVFNFILGRFILPYFMNRVIQAGYREFYTIQFIIGMVTLIFPVLIYKIISQNNTTYKNINTFFLLQIVAQFFMALYYVLIIADVHSFGQYIITIPELIILGFLVYLFIAFIADKEMLPNIKTAMVLLLIPSILFSSVVYRFLNLIVFNLNLLSIDLFMRSNAIITTLFTVLSFSCVLYLINFFYSDVDETLPIDMEEEVDTDEYDFNY